MKCHIQPLRQAWLEIDLGALEHNVREIQKRIGDSTEIIGVVKADAYGHGSVECAQVMQQQGIHSFAVATVAEGLKLREAGITACILILGVVPDDCAEIVIENKLIPVVTSLAGAEYLSEVALSMGQVPDFLVAVDTGMGRIGLKAYTDSDIANVADDIRAIAELKGVRLVGLMSHFATSDEASQEYTNKQLSRFMDLYERISLGGISLPWRTIANSAGVMGYPAAECDAVRPGIILYGLYPSDAVDKSVMDLKPVMQVKANIVFLKTVPKGSPISYGRTFTTERESVIATIPVGYADGYTRRLSNKAEVIVHGKRVPVVGVICMDQCMIDVTDVPGVKIGDEVVLVGRDGEEAIYMEDLADRAGTIINELLCSFGARLPKVYKK